MRTTAVAVAVLLLTASAQAQERPDREMRARMAEIPWPKDPHKRLRELEEALGTGRETALRMQSLGREATLAGSARGSAESALLQARLSGKSTVLLAAYCRLLRLREWLAQARYERFRRDMLERTMLRQKLGTQKLVQ